MVVDGDIDTPTPTIRQFYFVVGWELWHSFLLIVLLDLWLVYSPLLGHCAPFFYYHHLGRELGRLDLTLFTAGAGVVDRQHVSLITQDWAFLRQVPSVPSQAGLYMPLFPILH